MWTQHLSHWGCADERRWDHCRRSHDSPVTPWLTRTMAQLTGNDSHIPTSLIHWKKKLPKEQASQKPLKLRYSLYELEPLWVRVGLRATQGSGPHHSLTEPLQSCTGEWNREKWGRRRMRGWENENGRQLAGQGGERRPAGGSVDRPLSNTLSNTKVSYPGCILLQVF